MKITSFDGWRLLGVSVVSVAVTALLFLPQHSLVQGYDWLHIHVFYKSYYRSSLLEGRIPLWNPFSGLGRPFLADAETATLYPPNLVFLLGNTPGLVGAVTLHVGLLLFGSLQLGQRLGLDKPSQWLAALGLALGASFSARLQAGQIQVFCTLCWLPWTLNLGCALQDAPNRRHAILFAGSVALMFLAGSPPYFWICLWTILLYLVTRSPSWRSIPFFALAGLLAFGLTAAQSLPFLELVSQGNRALRDPAFATQIPAEAWQWSSLFRPHAAEGFFTWERNFYVGRCAFLLAIPSCLLVRNREIRALVSVALVFSVFALGFHTPVLPWLAENIPGWGAFRVAARYAVVTATMVSFLAAFTLTSIRSYLSKRFPHLSAIAGVLALIPLLNSADLFAALIKRSNSYARPFNIKAEETIAGFLRDEGLLKPNIAPPRIFVPRKLVRENSGVLYGYATITSFSNPALANVWDYLHRTANVTPDRFEPIFLSDDIYSTPGERFSDAALAAIWKSDQKRLELNDQKSKRAYLVNSDGSPSPGTVNLLSFDPEFIRLEVVAERPGRLILSEAYYPGWRGKMDDGVEINVVATEGWMRSIPIPAGHHLVEVFFDSWMIKWGLWISLFTAVICGLLFADRFRAKGESQSEVI